MIHIWQFIKNNGDLLIIAIMLIVVFVLFIRDFDLKSKRSWMILLGLSAMGAAIFYRALSKNNLLKELEKREKELEKLEEMYKSMKERAEITEENYKQAKIKLEETKKKIALDILRADEKYMEDVRKMEKELKDTKPEDFILRIRSIINN